MPIRLCGHCRTRYVVGLVPKPGYDIHQCRSCGEALPSIPLQELQNHSPRPAAAHVPETLEEENLRRREELQVTRLRSEQLRSEARKGRLAVQTAVEESRAARQLRADDTPDSSDE